MKKLFISYTEADRPIAEWVSWEAKEAGFEVVIQAWHFRPGGDFLEWMHREVEAADHVLALLSDDYFDSKFGKLEWQAAMARDPDGARRILIPVRVQACRPSGLLRTRIYADLVGKDEAEARENLLAALAPGDGTPATKPPFVAGAPPDPAAPTARPAYPYTLPAIWNLPHQRNPHFTEREELTVASLREALADSGLAALTQIAVHGLGGVGKTQLAVEYAYRHAVDANDYELVWWVGAEDPVGLTGSLAALARELKLPAAELPDQEAAAAAARHELGRRGGWLLIFDNAPHPADVRPHLPQAGSGHVLITSRDPLWGSLARPLPVHSFVPAESRAFLARRLGLGEGEELAGGDVLAEELGHLPLALEQAAAYMEAAGLDADAYLERFRAAAGRLLAEGAPAEYPEPVARTWNLAFEAAAAEAEGAPELLALCAFLAPEAIPLEVLSRGRRACPEPLARVLGEPLATDAAVRALRRYSLIEAVRGELSVHRMVQAVTRDRLGEEGGTKWTAASVAVLREVFPYDQNDPATWARCEPLVPHVRVAAGHAVEMRVAPEATSSLLNEFGLHRKRLAQFAEAESALKTALDLAEAAYSHNHPQVAVRLNNLAQLLQATNRLSDAEPLMRRALAIDEARFGTEHPRVATNLNNLAEILGAKNLLTEAEHLYRRALSIHESSYGPEHPDVAIDLNNLAGILRGKNLFAEAEVLYRRALFINEASYSTDHPIVANALNNLAQLLQVTGRFAEAEPLMHRALSIDEAKYGPEHPRVAIDLNNLAGLLEATDRLAEAEPLYRRALSINQASYGSGHPAVALNLNNLASLLQARNRLGEAVTLMSRALEIFEGSLVLDHPWTITARRNLEVLLERVNEQGDSSAQ